MLVEDQDCKLIFEIKDSLIFVQFFWIEFVEDDAKVIHPLQKHKQKEQEMKKVVLVLSEMKKAE